LPYSYPGNGRGSPHGLIGSVSGGGGSNGSGTGGSIGGDRIIVDSMGPTAVTGPVLTLMKTLETEWELTREVEALAVMGGLGGAAGGASGGISSGDGSVGTGAH
jgi:hypothetical protein